MILQPLSTFRVLRLQVWPTTPSFSFIFETELCYAASAGVKLTTCLPLYPEGYRCAPHITPFILDMRKPRPEAVNRLPLSNPGALSSQQTPAPRLHTSTRERSDCRLKDPTTHESLNHFKTGHGGTCLEVVETGSSRSSWAKNKFEASLSDMGPCLKAKIKHNQPLPP